MKKRTGQTHFKRRMGITMVLATVVAVGIILLMFSTLPRFADWSADCEEKGEQAFQSGEYAAALGYWLKSEKGTGNRLQLYEKIASASLKLSNLDLAETYLKKILEITSSDLVSQKQLIRIYLLKGDLINAEKNLSQLKTSGKADDYEMMILRGDLYLLQADMPKAESAYRIAVDMAPDILRPQIKLAICLNKQGNLPSDGTASLSGVDVNAITSAEDLMLMSDYFALKKRLLLAEACIRKAVAFDPGNLEIKTQLCRFYLSYGMLHKAEQYLELISGQNPEHRGFQLMLADARLSLLHMDLAEEMLISPDIKRFDDAGYNLLMGKFWLFKGRHSHAVSYLKSALEKNFGMASVHYLLGVAYFAGGQFKLAEKALNNSLAVSPNHPDPLLAMAALHYKQKEYALSEQYLDDIFAMDPASAQAWLVRGLCLFEQKDYEKATQAFSNAWHMGAGLQALFFLGQSFEHRQMPKEALKSYESILEKSPDHFEALNRYCMLLAGNGDPDRAISVIEEWLDTKKGGSPGPEILYTGAKICLQAKKRHACCRFLDLARQKNLFSGDFYILQADLWKARGEAKKRLETLTACTENEPLFLKGWHMLTDDYISQKNFTLAEQTLEKAVTHFPDDPVLSGNLAWLLLEKELPDTDRAFRMARKAYDHMQQPWLMDTLGWAYYHKGRFSQAEWMLTQAREKLPDNAAVTCHLGMALYKQGRLSEAKKILENAMEMKGLSPAQQDDIEQVFEMFKKVADTDDSTDPFSIAPDNSGQNKDTSMGEDSLDMDIDKLFIE